MLRSNNLAEIDDFEFDPEVIEEVEKIREKNNVKVTTIIQEDKKISLKDQFVIAFTSNLRALADLNISQNELKIITYILEVMEYGNLISINQSAIAKDLNIHRSNVSYNFKKLIQKGILIKKNGHIFMNSNLFAKGLSHKMNKERRKNIYSAQDDTNFKDAF
ncbi:replication/maintenance protein RepL [Salmonella enterica]|uniref:replication/maintenance protein RepL n=1 Tax=Enterobacter ludwigii TaxID=299767 RepID=UPI0034E656E7